MNSHVQASIRSLGTLCFFVSAWLSLIGFPGTAAPAAEPYSIAVHLSTDKRAAGGPEEQEVVAIREFVELRVDEINRAGGIKGRKLKAVFYDDENEAERTISNVKAALGDPNMLAMVGLWNSTRGALVVDAIGRSNVPFISEMSVERLFANYPNIYTLTRSVRDEKSVFAAFARDGFKRVVFVGASKDAYTRDYRTQLEGEGNIIAASHWVDAEGVDSDERLDDVVRQIREQQPDLVFLSLGSGRGAQFLARMQRGGVRAPVFVGLGSISGLVRFLADKGGYDGSLYEIAEGGIANLNNERLEELMRGPLRKALSRSYSPYSVGYGARYADLVQLIAEMAMVGSERDVTRLREVIAGRLAKLKVGRRVWRGVAQDWSFTNERASAEHSLLVWLKPGEEEAVLAPMQYVRKADGLDRVPVIYVHMDLVRLHRVESNDKTFEAEFYFTLRSAAGVEIDAIEFTNAFHGPKPVGSQVESREVHREDGPTDKVRVYRVTGRFTFEPDLTNFPFDQQVFSISFQPASQSKSFFLQPPAEDVRDRSFLVDGWRVKNHYVGTRELIIESIANAHSERRVIPYYNFNYTWVMERQVVDYLLRVVVPLSFIIVVAYLANFIPRSEFEAIIAIQVTALLSAIALYLALNQPSSDVATLSDQIFVVAYAVISGMIALSVFEVNTTLSRSKSLMRLVTLLQIYLIPLIASGVILYLLSHANVAYDPVDGMRRLVDGIVGRQV